MNIENEIWKSLDFLGYPDYEVSNMGRVKSLNYKRTGKEKILKPSKNKFGYLVVGLHKNGKGKKFYTHRLVCLAFLENPNNLPCVNHKDENPLNSRVENLEFCTHEYNNSYGTKPERISKTMKGKYNGENHPMYGKHHTEESKRKMSIASKGKHHTEETKKKISEIHKGKKLSEETKQKLSIVNKGKGSKPISQYTLDGVFIRDWDSATTASKELNLNQGSITQCCKEKRKTCGDFIWRYK